MSGIIAIVTSCIGFLMKDLISALLRWRWMPLSMTLAACGSVDMPDAGLDGSVRTTNGEVIAPSAEIQFDLSQCGFDASKPGTQISSRRMSMVPVTKTVNVPVLGGILVAQQNVTISSLAINEDSLARSVGTFSAQVSPEVSSPDVTALLNQYSGGYAADLIDVATRSKIGETFPDWKGVFCSFQPAIKLQKGSAEKVIAELSRPIPVSPLLTAPLSRLKSEIGVKRTWSGITAKVSESTDPNVPVGSTWTGRVESMPVSSSAAINGPNGRQTIQSELAVKMTYDFGSVAANRALGLPKSVIWYIDTSTKSYKLTAVDLGDGQPIYYLPAQ
jgi:hypothetical protein